jgi:hypothetical protein
MDMGLVEKGGDKRWGAGRDELDEDNCRPWGLPHGPILFALGSTACLLSRTSPLGLVRAPFRTWASLSHSLILHDSPQP